MTIGMLIMILLFPVGMVQDLISERESRKDEAINEISAVWGGTQLIKGPIITIPYFAYEKQYQSKTETYTTQKIKRFAHFLPEELNIDVQLEPEVRYRSIYEAIVYKSKLKISGFFIEPNTDLLNLDKDEILWNEATLFIGISDLRSIKDEVQMNWAHGQLSFDPGHSPDNYNSKGIIAKLKNIGPQKNGKNQLSFDVKLQLNGSSAINFSPCGKRTNVNIESAWPDPSFTGSFLPERKEISKEGFTAHWEVFHLNRPYPQQFVGSTDPVGQSTFGVNLLLPVDDYQQSTRSIKYAVLLISLTFLMFFFAQVFRKIEIHPIQYLIVGFALCLFYTLLVALSEHIGFQKAYILAGISTITSIVMYIQGFFKSNRLTSLVGGLLGIIFAFIFIIIKQQDYALLMGSIGTSVILTIIMVFTRKINWTSVGKNEVSTE